MREIIFDTETTGLSPQDGHRVFEIGAVELEGRLPTGRTFHHFLNPERDLSADSIRITGITDDKLVGKPTFADIVDDWLAFIEGADLVAHNANFDMSFMNYEMELLGKPALANTVIDTLDLARKKLPGARHNLDSLCKRFNVTMLEEREFHGALLDARLLAEVYVELTGGLQGSLIEEEEDHIPQQKIAAVKHIHFTRSPLIIQPTANEQANHEAAIQQLEKSLWSA